MDCLTFDELQRLGRDLISKVPETEIVIDSEPTFEVKSVQKRVRFVFDEEPKSEKMLKSDHFIVISRKIILAEREKIYKWLDERGFELIWSLDAALEYSTRQLIYLYPEQDQDRDRVFQNTNKINQCITIKSNFRIEKTIIVEGAYFRIIQS